ncbi:hypothetical protein P170DRAFT_461507 [Aspergillus steynii IBT 23096]|uniref:Uncharacterized protein n=1 Tax=Aspergillus steynii IBT 23096 TaxID=1392250 RepID=A0A2I2GS41_9EURO|nr:uncharacterized protein P170DRAFT_461507 [Aspergillus steynii IBT 23096]PLB55697.1 hypothetical protein P170DRAFT_461507 [Aspergillus steynii IBT 23096]
MSNASLECHMALSHGSKRLSKSVAIDPDRIFHIARAGGELVYAERRNRRKQCRLRGGACLNKCYRIAGHCSNRSIAASRASVGREDPTLSIRRPRLSRADAGFRDIVEWPIARDSGDYVPLPGTGGGWPGRLTRSICGIIAFSFPGRWYFKNGQVPKYVYEIGALKQAATTYLFSSQFVGRFVTTGGGCHVGGQPPATRYGYGVLDNKKLHELLTVFVSVLDFPDRLFRLDAWTSLRKSGSQGVSSTVEGPDEVIHIPSKALDLAVPPSVHVTSPACPICELDGVGVSVPRALETLSGMDNTNDRKVRGKKKDAAQPLDTPARARLTITRGGD